MKKFAAIFLALFMILALPDPLAEVVTLITPTPNIPPDLTLRPTEAEVMVYAIPSMKANIVGYIIVGGCQEVTVEAVQGDWVQVRFTSIHGTSEGWIPLSYFGTSTTPTPPLTPTPKPVLTGTAFICNPQTGFRLNLRTAPSVSATSLGKYYTGTPIILTGERRDGYVKAVIGSVTGWLDARYVTTDPGSFSNELPHVTVANPGSGANLRSGASTSTSRLGWYPPGTAVTILGVREDEWYHVAVDGQTGFMSCTLLSRTFPWHLSADSDAPAASGSSTIAGTPMYLFSAAGTHLRSAATASSRSLGVFFSGCPASVISYTRTGWAYVRICELSGYVDTGTLSAVRPNRTGQTRTIINPYGTGLNLRTMPTTDSPVIELRPNYSTVCVLGDLADEWCYVLCNGQYGYMKSPRLVP